MGTGYTSPNFDEFLLRMTVKPERHLELEKIIETDAIMIQAEAAEEEDEEELGSPAHLLQLNYNVSYVDCPTKKRRLNEMSSAIMISQVELEDKLSPSLAKKLRISDEHDHLIIPMHMNQKRLRKAQSKTV